MDTLGMNTSVQSTQPNDSPGLVSKLFGFFLGWSGSSRGLINNDAKVLNKSVGDELISGTFPGQTENLMNNDANNLNKSVGQEPTGGTFLGQTGSSMNVNILNKASEQDIQGSKFDVQGQKQVGQKRSFSRMVNSCPQPSLLELRLQKRCQKEERKMILRSRSKSPLLLSSRPKRRHLLSSYLRETSTAEISFNSKKKSGDKKKPKIFAKGRAYPDIKKQIM